MATVHRVVIAVALVAGLTACSSATAGSGQRSPGSTQPASGSTAAGSAASSAGSTAAQTSGAGGGPAAATLPALVVQAADVPGYTGDGSGGTQSKSDSDDPQTAACLGQPDPDQYFVAGYASDEFTTSALSIDSTVTSYNSTKAISIDRAYLANPTKLADCFKQDAASPDSGLPSGSTVTKVSVDPAPAGTPSNVLGVIDVQLTIPNSGQTVPVFVDEVLIVGTYIDESITISSAETAVSASLLQSLATTIANRIAGK
jgi:hypothetical protein